MSSRGYERLPMYASSESTTRLRSPTSTPARPLYEPSHSFTPTPISPPSRSRHRSWNNSSTTKTPWFRPRTILTILKFILPTIVLIFVALWFLYEPHIELSAYNRNWIKQEIEEIQPLAGCFDKARVSAKYNVSDIVYGRRKTEVQAGMPMRLGMDCYDFAGTIRAQPKSTTHSISTHPRTDFHSYWRTDLATFGERQEWMLKSFFATQDISSTRFVLWSNGDLSGNPILRKYVEAYPESFALQMVNVEELAKGTVLEGSALLKSKDSKAWTDGDLIRLLLLWTYGGVWIDMDSLLTRDLEPLLEHEFVTQWDCYGAVSQLSALYPLA